MIERGELINNQQKWNAINNQPKHNTFYRICQNYLISPTIFNIIMNEQINFTNQLKFYEAHNNQITTVCYINNAVQGCSCNRKYQFNYYVGGPFQV